MFENLTQRLGRVLGNLDAVLKGAAPGEPWSALTDFVLALMTPVKKTA